MVILPDILQYSGPVLPYCSVVIYWRLPGQKSKKPGEATVVQIELSERSRISDTRTRDIIAVFRCELPNFKVGFLVISEFVSMIQAPVYFNNLETRLNLSPVNPSQRSQKRPFHRESAVAAMAIH